MSTFIKRHKEHIFWLYPISMKMRKAESYFIQNIYGSNYKHSTNLSAFTPKCNQAMSKHRSYYNSNSCFILDIKTKLFYTKLPTK